jgi:choline-glycine betaine transporter
LQGNLRPIQVILLIVSFPILFVGVAMSIALVKTLKADYQSNWKPTE